MQLLGESLDDPEAAPCGRCSVCRGQLPEPLRSAPSAKTVAEVRGVLRQEQHVLDPRKMWPGGAFGARGRIPAGLMAEPGRVLVHADAAEWGELRNGPLRTDGEPPQDLLEAAVTCLSQWKTHWVERPSMVIALPASGHTVLTTGVAQHLSQVGQLEYAPWPVRGVPGPDLTSSDEAAGWRACLAEHPPPASAGQTILLVVDSSSSAWVTTVAAATLRQAGAGRVLPLLVHRNL